MDKDRLKQLANDEYRKTWIESRKGVVLKDPLRTYYKPPTEKETRRYIHKEEKESSNNLLISTAIAAIIVYGIAYLLGY